MVDGMVGFVRSLSRSEALGVDSWRRRVDMLRKSSRSSEEMQVDPLPNLMRLGIPLKRKSTKMISE
jgi:hypothetical protein